MTDNIIPDNMDNEIPDITTTQNENTSSDATSSQNENTSSDTTSSQDAKNINFDCPNMEDTEIPRRHFFHSQRTELQYMRDKWILSKIREEDLMEYLRMEKEHEEALREERENRERHFLTVLVLAICLLAIVTTIGLLKDNPTILLSILYIGVFVGCMYYWQNKKTK